eukprot:649959-Prorocentrum_minimum.AAC.1
MDRFNSYEAGIQLPKGTAPSFPSPRGISAGWDTPGVTKGLSCAHLLTPAICFPPLRAQVLSVYIDCDNDSLIYLGEPMGP